MLGVVIEDDSSTAGFIKSKWETVDPEQVEAQAMTTSKWDMLEHSGDQSMDSSQADNDGSNDYTDSRLVVVYRCSNTLS